MKKITILLLLMLTFPAFSQNKHPKNIILLIGDGMGVAQVYAGIIANKGHLNIERSQFIGFHKNHRLNAFKNASYL